MTAIHLQAGTDSSQRIANRPETVSPASRSTNFNLRHYQKIPRHSERFIITP
jgi:hypothetical protein